MDVLAPLIVIALLAVVVWLVSGPLRAGAAATDDADVARREDLEAAKEAKYREIRDAELDRGFIRDPYNEFLEATATGMTPARYMANRTIKQLEAFQSRLLRGRLRGGEG